MLSCETRHGKRVSAAHKEMPPGVVLGRSLFDLRRELKEAFGRKVDLHLPPNDAARTEYVRVLERTKVLIFDDIARSGAWPLS